jgi:hypothetical protein
LPSALQVETKEPNHAALHTNASFNTLAVHLCSFEKQKFASILVRTLLGSQWAPTQGLVPIVGVNHIRSVTNRSQGGCRITTVRGGKLEAEKNDNAKMNLHGGEPNQFDTIGDGWQVEWCDGWRATCRL